MAGEKIMIARQDTLEAVQDRIGTTADTGGSATAGTVMGKLNKVLSQVLGGSRAVKSVQRGLIPAGNNSTGYTEAFRFGTAANYTRVSYYDIRISEVDPSKCSVNIDVHNSDSGTFPNEVVNATTLRIYLAAITSSETSSKVQPFSWEVVEYY